MIGRSRTGFTIIEVMLFLAVGGLLTVGVMAGMGSTISAQRYKDAVATLQSDIQQQYEDTVSVVNNRTSEMVPEGCEGAAAAPRGTMECVILGKLMIIKATGDTERYIVYGREPSELDGNLTEYEIMQRYDPRVMSDRYTTSQMEWGTSIASPGSADDGGRRILVLRSPRSGATYTFADDRATMNTGLSELIGVNNANRRQVMCIIPKGWVITDRLAVTIAPYATSSSGVDVRTNQFLEGGEQCS